MDFKKSRVSVVGAKHKHLPRSDPQLPADLWKGFKKDFPKSIIFTPFFSDVRHLMLTGEQNPNFPFPADEFIGGVAQMFCLPAARENLNWSYLHAAVMHGDLPLAYETVRLGTSIHEKDQDGRSALYFGCELLARLRGKSLQRVIASLGPLAVSGDTIAHLSAQIHRVCLFLVSQHSDPNETHGDFSLLHFACITSSWDLIQYLLIFGANPCPSVDKPAHLPVNMLRNESDKVRFTALVSKLARAARPARLCPCASGRYLNDCHAVEQPYPSDYICLCRSRKIYLACCAKKSGLTWKEVWNEKADWLDHTQSITMSGQMQTADITSGQIMQQLALLEAMDRHNKTAYWPAIVDALAKKQLIDPAYAAASKQTKIAPSPDAVQKHTKLEWRQHVTKWNDAVDAYIASKVDRRAPQAIEDAAKIGVAGGPLYRRCEAAGCIGVEGRDSVTLFLCSSCKTVRCRCWLCAPTYLTSF
ncbi:hypothetical protein B0H10DRAFT_1356022 [Mycena sp. CBHHK59/15]|nr:hypothetical protein B0H10DRAFT_1356022 [Mycena sp. CBHHK59/15]